MKINNGSQLEQIIIKTLKESEGNYLTKEQTYEEIIKRDNNITQEEFTNTFNELIQRYEVVPSLKNNKIYAYVNDSHNYRKGIYYDMSKTKGCVKAGKYRFVVRKIYNNNAEEGDTVVLQFQNKYEKPLKENDKAIIVDCVKEKHFVGEVIKEDNKHIIVDYYNQIEIPDLEKLANFLEDKTIGYFSLKKVNNHYDGHMIQKITTSDTPTKEIDLIAADKGYFKYFSKEVEQEVAQLPNEVLREDYQGRIDLRDLKTFTIDGKTTKDFDDALSIYEKDNNNTVLMVHIADVAHYVKNNTNIDLEAYVRSFSYYPPGDVYPMLPNELSTGICSLQPGVDRLANTVYMEFDQQGGLLNYHIFPSVINSNKQMVYEEINEKEVNPYLYEDYDEYQQEIDLLKTITHKLQKQAEKKGRLELECDEMYFELDEDYNPTKINTRDRGVSEKIIENAMIKTNEVIFQITKDLNIPQVSRIHPTMNQKKLEKFIQMCDRVGVELDINDKMSESDIMRHASLEIKDHKHQDILSPLLIRSLSKAQYDTKDDTFHFGLASNGYSHFTAPIRRYPDLYIHRAIADTYFNTKTANDKNEQLVKDLKVNKINVQYQPQENIKSTVKNNQRILKGQAESVATQANEMKEKNDEIERLAANIYAARHLNDFYLNEKAIGKISNVNGTMVTVKMNELPVFGTAAIDHSLDYNYLFGETVDFEILESNEISGEIAFQLIKKQRR